MREGLRAWVSEIEMLAGCLKENGIDTMFLKDGRSLMGRSTVSTGLDPVDTGFACYLQAMVKKIMVRTTTQITPI